MGRKPKQLTEQVNVVDDNKTNTNEEPNVIDLLTKQLQDLQEQLKILKDNQNQSQKQTIIQPKVEQQFEPETTYARIDGRERIQVMSLSNIPLNLTTEPMGRGRIFQFAKFGEIKIIKYDDVVNIVYNHPNFTKEGRFLIMNPAVVRELGYEEDYSKILNKEKIETILENGQNALDLYKSTNEVQRKTIHEFLIRKVRDNLASVDTSLIMAIKQISNIDIIAEAEKIKVSVLEETN
jgi:predicted Zn-ribbon and HTH transcriptional regulator